ncbi:MAG: hypothetical protein WCA08_03360 [Desulfoferrobacter sp.]
MREAMGCIISYYRREIIAFEETTFKLNGKLEHLTMLHFKLGTQRIVIVQESAELHKPHLFIPELFLIFKFIILSSSLEAEQPTRRWYSPTPAALLSCVSNLVTFPLFPFCFRPFPLLAADKRR